jgi:aquaporin Z
MVVAAAVGSILEYPGSPLHQAVPLPFHRHAIGGTLMGLTAVGLVHSPWGRQSGAHMNPSLTLAFLHLGKVARWDAVFYVSAQVVGGCAGIIVASTVIGSMLAHPAVNYIATVPGTPGALVAWIAEAAISFVLMFTVLATSNTARLSRLTPLFAGVLIAVYITFESPLSGMSMNPARSLGPAVLAGAWRSLWVYFTGPPLGMLLAAELFVRTRGAHAVWCAKLHHDNHKRCIFHCTRPAQ